MGARDLLTEDAARAAIRGWWSEHLVPAPLESMAAWASQFREIAKGPEKGPWRNERTPYLVGPMDAMSEGSPFQRVVMQFATQMGKTEVLYNAVLQRIHRSPLDMMIVQPTLQDAKDHSRERFMPTVRRMPSVLTKLAAPTSRDESSTWQTKSILGGSTLFFAGANSARSLASKPLGLVVCDEIDGWPQDVDGEGRPLDIVAERMSNFPNRKMLVCSTPTVRGFSLIESEYLASDRRRFYVPCPHCGDSQVLEWGATTEWGLKWLKTPTGEPRPDTAVYVCRHCAAAIGERNKADMLPAGVWVPEAPGAASGKVAGFQISKLYSPLGWRSWAWMVEQWDKAMEAARAGDSTKLKTFINTNLAETFEEQGDKADEHALRRRAADIPVRVVTWGCYVMTLGGDGQGDRLEAYAWAWGRGMERQLVDRQVIYGDPAIPESEAGSPWGALTEYRRTPILHASGKPVPVLACMIDSGGHHTQAVYAYARSHQHAGVHAVKGSSQSGKIVLGKPTDQDLTWRGEKHKRGVKLWPIGTDTAKAEIYGRLRIAAAGPGFVHLSKHLPPEVFEQLTAERLVTRYVKGHPRLEWVKPPGRRNEALDCAVYALAGAHKVGIDRWKEGDWAKWEARVQARDLFDAPATPDATKATEPPVSPAPAPEQAPKPPARGPWTDYTGARPKGFAGRWK